MTVNFNAVVLMNSSASNSAIEDDSQVASLERLRRESGCYRPQLDSLRALAALAVFAQHFLQPGNVVTSVIPLGDLGVRLFFVLSGFLITEKLLYSAAKVEQRSSTVRQEIKNFYVRRFMRLTPVYFLFITVVFAVNEDSREYAIWFYTYLQNIHFAMEGRFSIAAHMWTLAVEEQFYLMWPLIIVLWPKRNLHWILIAVVVSGPLFRIAWSMFGGSHFSGSMLTVSHLDTLGMGALLAFLKHVGWMERKRLYFLSNTALVIGIAVLGLVLTEKLWLVGLDEFGWGELGAGMTFVWVIAWADRGFGGLLGRFLELSGLVYLGKISYGMYVYHYFVPDLIPGLSRFVDVSTFAGELIVLCVYSATGIGIAMVSWHLMEHPVLKMKKRFS